MADDLHLVTFNVGAELFGVPISSVQEIVRAPAITRIPQSPPFIEGVINLRGRVVPVVDMRRRLGQPEGDGGAVGDGRSRILVVEVERRQVGVVVSEVSEVIKLPAENVEPAPPMVSGFSNRYLDGVGKLNDALLILVDIGRLFTEEEASDLDALRDGSELAAA